MNPNHLNAYEVLKEEELQAGLMGIVASVNIQKDGF